MAGKCPAFCCIPIPIPIPKPPSVIMAKELSIFIDESGDFGPYSKHSPYYIIGFIFHDQSRSISAACEKLDESLSFVGISKKHNIHTAPLIRREESYKSLSIRERRAILGKILAFSKSIDFSYVSISVDKKQTSDRKDLVAKLHVRTAEMIESNLAFFMDYDRVKIYYDNGQSEISKLISGTFGDILNNTKRRKITPSEYKLAQLADFICTFHLLDLKSKAKTLSKSELAFFGSPRELRKNYLKQIQKKRF